MRVLNKSRQIFLAGLLFYICSGCSESVTCEKVNLNDQTAVYTFAQEKYQRYHSQCFYGKNLKITGVFKYDKNLSYIYLTDSLKNVDDGTLRLGIYFKQGKKLSPTLEVESKELSGRIVEIRGRLISIGMINPTSIVEIE